MGYWNCKFDVPHAVAPHARDCYLDAAAVADYTLVLDAFVLSASALPIAGRPEYLLAEEAIALGAVCAVVDRLWIAYLAVAPGSDRIGGREGDAYGIIVLWVFSFVEYFFSNKWIQCMSSRYFLLFLAAARSL